MSDQIKVIEAASILGVSTKRVRQYIDEGKLKQLGESPITVSRKEVLAFHASRQNNLNVKRASIIKKDSTMAILDAVREMNEAHRAQVSDLIEEIKTERNKAILSAEMNQANLLAEINRLKAELESARKRRGFFRK
jgi:hypothetical protein